MPLRTLLRRGSEPAQGRRRPVLSLPARITFFVFWATVITSLTVTAISVNSINSFLRGNIEQKFPAILSAAEERLDLWYDQRILEIGVFANSAILENNMRLLAEEPSAQRAKRSRAEIRQYLSYLLESFPQYESLFIVDALGKRVLWVGEPAEIPTPLQRLRRPPSRVSVGHLVIGGERRLQVASARLDDPTLQRNSLGTLHALLRLERLDEVLAVQELDSSVRLLLVGSAGRSVAASSDWQLGERFPSALAAAAAASAAAAATKAETAEDANAVQPSAIAEYETPSGERVVGSAKRLSRFGWTVLLEEPYDEAFAPVLSSISKILGIDLAIVLLFGLGAYRIAVSIVKPIEALSDAAQRMSDGDEHVLLPETGDQTEVGLLTRTFNSMSRALVNKARELEHSRREIEEANRELTAQNRELSRMNEVLEQLSITDGLTKLHNHRYFQDHLTREARRVDRTNEPLVLILADIDHFKGWNDRLGHAAGDRILREVADVMNEVIRESDLLARYGGEEFALLTPGTDLAGGVALAEKIRGAVARHTFVITPPSEREQITLSFGVAEYHGDREAFFDEADCALYAAKSAGRDCVMTVNEEPGV